MASAKKIDGKKGVSYKLIASVGYDGNGKQIRRFMTWRPPEGMPPKSAEKEAARQALLFETMVKNGGVTYDGNTRFSDYAEKWLERAQIAPTTRVAYQRYLKRINAAIGLIPLSKLQPHHLEMFYQNLREDGVRRKPKYLVTNTLSGVMAEKGISIRGLAEKTGLSPTTVDKARSGRVKTKTAEKIAAALGMTVAEMYTPLETSNGTLSDITIVYHHRLLTTILRKAVKERIIPHAVTDFVTAPKFRRKEANYLTDTEAQTIRGLLLEEDDIRIKTSLLMLLYTGVRRGELCGLTWSDIDEQTGLVYIRRSSQYIKGEGMVEAPLKTESSRRDIKLPSWMFEILAEYRKWWAKQKLINGSKWQGRDSLFIQSCGKPVHSGTISYWLDKFIKKHGLRHFTPHSLRHTFITLQITGGIDVRTLQARTGHARASMLTDTYSHAIMSANERAAAVLDNILMPQKTKEAPA
jgi:integrase